MCLLLLVPHLLKLYVVAFATGTHILKKVGQRPWCLSTDLIKWFSALAHYPSNLLNLPSHSIAQELWGREIRSEQITFYSR